VAKFFSTTDRFGFSTDLTKSLTVATCRGFALAIVSLGLNRQIAVNLSGEEYRFWSLALTTSGLLLVFDPGVAQLVLRRLGEAEQVSSIWSEVRNLQVLARVITCSSTFVGSLVLLGSFLWGGTEGSGNSSNWNVF
jgi:hypothetical protein